VDAERRRRPLQLSDNAHVTRRKLEGVWTTGALGRPCFEVLAASPDLIDEVARMLREQWGFPLPDPPIVGLSEVLARTSRDGVTITLEWDVWSGFSVQARSAKGDAIVRELAVRLEPLLSTPAFERFAQDY
jgi:hypothetical protein